MYGLTRGIFTLVGAAVAGFLIWLATQLDHDTNGGYWAAYGIIAGAGLTMALSQLFGGWTKWGWPRVSATVFLLGFLPVLIVGGWVVLHSQPESTWFSRNLLEPGDIGLSGLIGDLGEVVGVIAFGVGLVFGLTFDTTGPRTEPILRRRRAAAEPTHDVGAAEEPLAAERVATATTPSVREGEEPRVGATSRRGSDERPIEIRESGTPVAPQPEPPPRGGQPRT